MKCPGCGKEIEVGKKYCGYCGFSIREFLENTAEDELIEAEGNQFLAIKNMKQKLNIDNAVAKEHVLSVLNKYKQAESNSYSEGSSVVDNKKYESNDIHHIKRTIIVSSSQRKSVGSMLTRGVVGSALLGPLGALAGGASAKNKGTTTFQVIYYDGKQETVTVKNNSNDFEYYCKFLDR